MWPMLKCSMSKANPWELSEGIKWKHPVGVHTNKNFNEEYMEAFRTKSYTDICSKIQFYTRRTNAEPLCSSPFSSYLHISDCLLEPRQEILLNMISDSSGPHTLLLDFFERSLEACNACGFLLHCIDETRTNYRIIQRILNLSKRVAGDYTEDRFRFVCAEFTSFTGLKNPLSRSNLMQFEQVNVLYNSMFKRLKSKHKRIIRKAKFTGYCKKALGASLVIACGALAIVALILTAHISIGLLAMAMVMRSTTLLARQKFKLSNRVKGKSLAQLGDQLDAAVKGAYILNRDFDTMSRLMTRLHDEIEHSKAVIRIFLRNENTNLLEQVVKELRSGEAGFLQQLEELEEHVYLCFLKE